MKYWSKSRIPPGVAVRQLLRQFRLPVSWLLRAVPQRHRFRTMLLVSRLILPIVSLLPRYRGYDLDGPREEALRLLMSAAAQAGLEYDPFLELSGIECLDDAVTQYGSALVLSAHFSLNELLFRAMHDGGQTVAAVWHHHDRDRAVITGTSIPMRDIALSPTVLVEIRNALRHGSVVFIEPDLRKRREHAVSLVETKSGRLFVSPTVFEFAEETGTPIVFAAARGHGSQILTTFARPDSGTTEGMIQEFRAFIDQHARSRPSKSSSSTP